MTLVLILLSAGLLGVIVRLLAALLIRPPRVPGWLRLVFVVVMIGGVYLTSVSFDDVRRGLYRRDWPTTRGTIVQSEMVGDRAIRPEIVFTYVVGDSSYRDTTDLNPPAFGNRRRRREVAETWVKQYPPGTSVDIHYREDSPGEAYIRVSPPWNVYAQTGLGLFVILLAGFFVSCPGRS